MGERNVLSARALLLRWLVAVALALLALSASARSTDRTAELLWSQSGNTATGTVTKGGSASQPTTYGRGGGKAYAERTKQLPWPGRSQAENMAKWKQWATPQGMAKSMMRPGAAVGIVAGVGIGLLLNEACVRVFGGSMQLADGAQWEQCVFGQTTVTVWRTNVGNGTNDDSSPYVPEADDVSQAASCNKGAMIFAQQWPSSGVVRGEPRNFGSATSPNWSCEMYNAQDVYQGGLLLYTVQKQQLAQTGWESATEAAAEAKITTKLEERCGADNQLCSDVLKELLDKGAQVEVEELPQVTGPAEVPGNPKVEKITNPDGSTTTRTTNTTNKYTYQDNRVTQTIVTTVTNVTVNPDGSSTTQTEQKEEADQRTHCEKYPNDDQCTDDRDVPSGDIPRSNRVLTYVAESLGFGSGSCPADIIKTYRGQSVTVFSYAKGCELLTNNVKPIVLLLSAWIAFVILVPGGPGKGDA